MDPITDVKKYDKFRRVYLPRWVEEELGLIPGKNYVTFVSKNGDITIKKVNISLD